jgi:hypothetical protein
MSTTGTTPGEIVASNIAEELSRRGWDHELLADATDIPMSKLAACADDASRMTMNELAAVASALDIRAWELLAEGGRAPIPDPSTWGTPAPGAGETFDVDELTPASEEGLRALTAALGAINDARGTSHTVESVAESLGMVEPLSVAETSVIARHIGGVLMADRS